jgi:flagellar protein FliS
MTQDIQNTYRQSEILHASPVQLVILLYRGALSALAQARLHLAQGAIRERSAQVQLAFDILTELTGALDREQGGDFAMRLVELYDYMQRRLVAANAEQSAEPLLEVEALLRNLLEGWEAIDGTLPEKVAQPLASTYPAYSPAPEFPSLSCTF